MHKSTLWSDSVEQLMSYDAPDNAFLRAPKMQEFNKLFRQITFGHQKIIKISDAEALICETVLEILTMSSYSQYDLKGKTVFNWPVHRKTTQQQKVPICRVITLWCKNEDSRKIAILVRLSENMVLGKINWPINNNY